MNATMNIHGAEGVRVIAHLQRDTTEWATIRIGELQITVFEREAIDDALCLPRSADFKSDFPADREVA